MISFARPSGYRPFKSLASASGIVALVMLGSQTSAEIFLSPKEGGQRRLQTIAPKTEAFAQPGLDAEPSDILEKGAVLSNMGCKAGLGDVWCEVRPFRGGPRGYVRAEHLEPAIGPDGNIPTGVNQTPARVAKRDFDEGGQIACAQERGQSLGICKASVARTDGGDATIAVTFSNGFTRKLFFRNGEFVSASATMSGVGRDIDWQLKSDTHYLRVDDQRFEISNSFVFGK